MAAASKLLERTWAIDFNGPTWDPSMRAIPQPRSLAGRITAEELVSNVQKKYETELGR